MFWEAVFAFVQEEEGRRVSQIYESFESSQLCSFGARIHNRAWQSAIEIICKLAAGDALPKICLHLLEVAMPGCILKGPLSSLLLSQKS